jgi:hypothetical protein
LSGLPVPGGTRPEELAGKIKMRGWQIQWRLAGETKDAAQKFMGKTL